MVLMFFNIPTLPHVEIKVDGPSDSSLLPSSTPPFPTSLGSRRRREVGHVVLVWNRVFIFFYFIFYFFKIFDKSIILSELPGRDDNFNWRGLSLHNEILLKSWGRDDCKGFTIKKQQSIKKRHPQQDVRCPTKDRESKMGRIRLSCGGHHCWLP